MNPPRCFFRGLLVAIVVTPVLFSTLIAQSTNRKIGTQFEVTADPLVLRPGGQPCVVTLFSDYRFAFFSDTAQTFTFAPPANCPGPWKKVVFEADFSENPGVQFDRTATVFLANANIYFGTTPEPLSTLTNTWHVERDLTDYSALLSTPQTGTIVLANCTTDCPPPFNTELNGIFTVAADLKFYPANRHDKDKDKDKDEDKDKDKDKDDKDNARHDRDLQSRAPDAVLPLVQVNSSGGINLPANVFSPTDLFSTTFTLPRNVERAYLDVVAQSQSTDEQWYACFPNDLSAINEIYGCGNTDFRETEVSIDGQPAGIAPVSPWVYTGFLPDQWVPMPGAQTLDFVPYRVNLTPFAAWLSDGNPHTVALSVFNDDSYFSVTAALLLFLDPGTKQITGAVTQNTLTGPSPVVAENLQGTDTVTGTIGVTSDRRFTIAGYVRTSHGKVSTSVSQHQNFVSTQTINFDTVNFTVLDQKTSVQSSLSSATRVSSRTGSVVSRDHFSFPITVDFTFPVDSAPFGFTVATAQKYHTDRQVLFNGFLTSFNSLTNAVNTSDVSPTSSSQHYDDFDSDGVFYDCQIASKNNTLTKVSRGCKSDRH